MYGAIRTGLATRLLIGLKIVKTYYRRHLPHYQAQGAAYHVVFRLAGSLPLSAVEKLRQLRERFERELKLVKNRSALGTQRREFRQQYFERFDALLDGNSSGPLWLRQPEIASIVHEAIRYRDGKFYNLLASCVMPNHVHIVFEHISSLATAGRREQTRLSPTAVGMIKDMDGTTNPSFSVNDILGSLKKFTARRANKVVGRRGAFWQDESYDHIIRDDRELERAVWYVINNPVAAGFVKLWEQWPWTYLKAGLL